MYTHSSFQGPVRTGTFEKLANRVYIPQGMPYMSTGRVYFLVLPMALKFLRLLRFLLSWKTQLIKISVRYTCDTVGEKQCYQRIYHKAVYLVMCLLTIKTFVFCFLSPGLHGPDEFLNGRISLPRCNPFILKETENFSDKSKRKTA